MTNVANIVLFLSCVVLVMTVIAMFRTIKDLLNKIDIYKKTESYKQDKPPLYDLYIDDELILRDCISWHLEELDVGRKLTVKTEDSFSAYYTEKNKFCFVNTKLRIEPEEK